MLQASIETPHLVLDITRREHGLAMSLSDSGSPHSTIRHYAPSGIPLQEARRLSQEITRILNKGYARGELDAEQMTRLRKDGHLLWTQAVASSVRDKLKSFSAATLTLFLDEELISVPWELVYDGDDFLCLKFAVGRLVRSHSATPPREQYRAPASVQRMLVLANPTDDLASAYYEGVAIRNRLDALHDKVRVDFKSTSVDRNYVRKNLHDYDIVHFAGHCEFDPALPQNSGWVLDDGRLTAADIVSLGAGSFMPSLVFSNACQSAAEDPRKLEIDEAHSTYSIASAFLLAGVRHYIGALRRVEDSLGAVFAQEFYRFLVSGMSVGESLRLTRLEIISRHGIERMLWAGYILYGAPQAVLLPGPQPKLPARAERVRAVRLHLVSDLRRIQLPFLLCCVFAAAGFLFWQSRYWTQERRLESLFEGGQNEHTARLAVSLLEKHPERLLPQVVLADTYYRMGDKEKALSAYYAYALRSEQQKDAMHLARAYSSLGWYYHLEGDFDRARDFYSRAIDISRSSSDVLNEAIALRRLAVWYIDKKMFNRALELLTRSSELNRERAGRSFEHRYHLACDYFDLGLVFANKDDYDTARSFYHKSRALFEKLRKPSELSDCWFNLGELCQLEKQYHTALEYYTAGLNIDLEQGNTANLSGDYNMIGELYAEMGQSKQAEESFLTALGYADRLATKIDIAAACRNLGKLYLGRDAAAQARPYLTRAFDIYRELEMSEAEDVHREMGLCGA